MYQTWLLKHSASFKMAIWISQHHTFKGNDLLFGFIMENKHVAQSPHYYFDGDGDGCTCMRYGSIIMLMGLMAFIYKISNVRCQ